MNLAEAFAGFLEDQSIATLGQDLYIGHAPNTRVVDNTWWIRTSGGSKQTSLQSGEAIKQYQIEVFYRDRDYKSVYDKMHNLEELLNSGCLDVAGFETIDTDAVVFPIDNDLDDEDRKVGLLQVNVRVYKE